MAISAALAAYFGVRVRARQIRLISSPAWAQQGRVSVQASHALMH
jgi:methylmalonyl-CoA carboxyltransferase large subunit